MIARCIRTFRDAENGNLHEVGETFEVTEERFKAMNSTKYGKLAEKVEEPKAKRPRKTVKEQ